MSEQYSHFNGKEAIEHVAQNQARGKISACEIHGAEIPGFLSAGADAAKDTAVIFLLTLPFLESHAALYFGVFLIGWCAWRISRAAWLGWARLERLHGSWNKKNGRLSITELKNGTSSAIFTELKGLKGNY